MITPTPRLISFMINLSMPNPCPRRPHSATQNATGQRTEEVTAAYVAKLDSICATAQAKVKNEIKRSRSSTNRRSSRRGNASSARRCPSCVGPCCRRRFTGPTRDEHSRSWRSSTHIRAMCGHRNRWPSRSSRSRPRQVHLSWLTSVASRSQQRGGARRPEPAEAKRHYVVVVVSLLPLRVIAVYAKLKIAAPATLITHRIQSRPKVLLPPRRPHTQ